MAQQYPGPVTRNRTVASRRVVLEVLVQAGSSPERREEPHDNYTTHVRPFTGGAGLRLVRGPSGDRGFLAGYGDTTRAAYSLDLRQWLGWCASHDLSVFEVKRAHIELFARSLEHDGKARATVARRLSTIAGFYRYCVEELLIPVSPAVHVRRPRLDYESNATGLDRNELGMFLVQAGLRRPRPRTGVPVGVERAPDLRSAQR